MSHVVRRLLVLSTSTVAALTAVTASAQTDFRPVTREPKEPDLAVEVRFGPYRPRVDEHVGKDGNGEGPYQKIFGDDKRFMLGLEVDWQAYHLPHFGSFGVGGSISYTKASGFALIKTNGLPSEEEAGLTIWPFVALGVVRIDVLEKDFGIPIIPYGKIGPGVAFWSSSNGRGTSVGNDGTLGRGHSAGLVYAVGGQFLLDILDRQGAKSFAIERGVKHSYLFFEYTVTDFGKLGQTNAMYLGDKTWNLGFMFEL